MFFSKSHWTSPQRLLYVLAVAVILTLDVLPPRAQSTSCASPSSTAVNSDTSLTTYETSSISSATSFTYNGYFINPIFDRNPPSGAVGYPGGMLVGTSNGGTSTSAVIWALLAAEDYGNSNEAYRTVGTLYAYDTGLNLKWYSSATFCASSLALPTVVHGQVFVPTYAATSCPTSGSPVTSGLLVYH